MTSKDFREKGLMQKKKQEDSMPKMKFFDQKPLSCCVGKEGVRKNLKKENG